MADNAQKSHVPERLGWRDWWHDTPGALRAALVLCLVGAVFSFHDRGVSTIDGVLECYSLDYAKLILGPLAIGLALKSIVDHRRSRRPLPNGVFAAVVVVAVVAGGFLISAGIDFFPSYCANLTD